MVVQEVQVNRNSDGDWGYRKILLVESSAQKLHFIHLINMWDYGLRVCQTFGKTRLLFRMSVTDDLHKEWITDEWNVKYVDIY